MNARAISSAAFAATLTIGALALTPRAHATTGFQVYSGTGWKIATNNGVRSLGSSSWTIVFYDTTSRTALTPNAKRTAPELKKNTGVTFTVTTTISKGATVCPTGRVIIMRLTSADTVSHASQCHTATGVADGSRAVFALGNWQNKTNNGSHDIYRRKVVSHELGHSVGLDHPATFTTNPSPLMRGDIWGGYKTLTYASYCTAQDITGLKNLRANSTKLPPPTTLTSVAAVNGAQVTDR